MIRLSYYAFFLLLIQGSLALAYQPIKGKITASTGPYLFTSDFGNDLSSFESYPKLGWGLVAEGVFAKNMAVEVGLFHFDKPYLKKAENEFLLQSKKRIYITTLVRTWLVPDLSFAGGIFTEYSIGETQNLQKSQGFSEGDFETAAEKVSTHGMDFSLRYEWDLSNKRGFFVDLRYSYNITSRIKNENANHVAVFLSYRQELEVD